MVYRSIPQCTRCSAVNMIVIDLTVDNVPKEIQVVEPKDKVCGICLEYNVKPTWIGCGGMHVYCRKCIKSWLKLNPTCPSCRSKIKKRVLRDLGVRRRKRRRR